MPKFSNFSIYLLINSNDFLLPCTNLSKCNSVIITILLHLSCLTVDSTAHLDSMFPTRFREERGGETDWRTPPPQTRTTPRTSSAPSSPKSSTPRTRLGPRTLSGSSCYSYPLSWWAGLVSYPRRQQQVGHINTCICCQSVQIVKLFML